MPFILLLIVLGVAVAAFLYVRTSGDDAPTATFDDDRGFSPSPRSPLAELDDRPEPGRTSAAGSSPAPAAGPRAAAEPEPLPPSPPATPGVSAPPVTFGAVPPPPATTEPLVRARVTASAIDWTPPQARLGSTGETDRVVVDDPDDDSYLDRFTARSAPAYVPPLTDVGPASGQVPAVGAQDADIDLRPDAARDGLVDRAGTGFDGPAPAEPATAVVPTVEARPEADADLDPADGGSAGPVAETEESAPGKTIDVIALEVIDEPTGPVIDLRDGDGAAAFARGAEVLADDDPATPDASVADADAHLQLEAASPEREVDGAEPVVASGSEPEPRREADVAAEPVTVEPAPAEPVVAASTEADDDIVIDLDALESAPEKADGPGATTTEPDTIPAARFEAERDPIDQIIQALIDRARERRIAVADVAAELVEQAQLEDRAIDDVLADLVDRVDGAGRPVGDELTLYSDAAPRRPGRLSQLEHMDSQEKKRVIVRVLCLLVASRAEDADDAELATVGAGAPAEPEPARRVWSGPRPGGRGRGLPERRIRRSRR